MIKVVVNNDKALVELADGTILAGVTGPLAEELAYQIANEMNCRFYERRQSPRFTPNKNMNVEIIK